MNILSMTLTSVALVTLVTGQAISSDSAPADKVDQEFAEKANQGGLFEVRSSELAIKRGVGASEKVLAQQMIDDHSKANKALAALATTKGITLSTEPDKKHQDLLDTLGKTTDKDFAKEYVSMQLKAHKMAVDLFSDEGKNGKDAELREFANETLPTLNAHLTHVKQVSDKE